MACAISAWRQPSCSNMASTTMSDTTALVTMP